MTHCVGRVVVLDVVVVTGEVVVNAVVVVVVDCSVDVVVVVVMGVVDVDVVVVDGSVEVVVVVGGVVVVAGAKLGRRTKSPCSIPLTTTVPESKNGKTLQAPLKFAALEVG